LALQRILFIYAGSVILPERRFQRAALTDVDGQRRLLEHLPEGRASRLPRPLLEVLDRFDAHLA